VRLPLPFATFALLVALAALAAAACLRGELRQPNAERRIGMARRFAKDGEGRRIAVEHAPHTLVSGLRWSCCARVSAARAYSMSWKTATCSGAIRW
jgi:hypothetical protein